MIGTTRVILITLILAVAILFAALAGAVTTVITRLGGTTLPSACLRGGIAFGGTLTLLLAVTTTIADLLK